ncbi:uncharacterized protein [Nicotiana sylvestris]|uniref:uncharacterized protein n=1 Tax=Nicotiana sylvestris TaxID=4096 RepID=UPI00388CE41C
MASEFMDRFRFNIENSPDVLYIQNLKKKPTETFREYTTRWRSEVAKVRPSLDEEQMNKFFIKAHDPQYYERLIVIENDKFSNIIKLGERIIEGIKSGMVEVALPAATSAPFEVEVVTPFTVKVSTTPPFNSKAIPWDYIAEAWRKGKANVEESDTVQGMTRIGRVCTPEHLGGSSKEATARQPIIETGQDNLWRKVQAKENSVVYHLNKVPAQISILSRLQNSEAHKIALMKVLTEAYVPNNITCGEMDNMVEKVLESHKIIFHEDELLPEGLNHNRPLHIIVQFEDKFIARVLVDGGSSLNVCPVDTLKRLDEGFHEATQHENSDSEEEGEIPEEIVREVENFENKPKSNLDETKAVNLGDVETVKETRISIHLLPTEKEGNIHLLKEYEDIFAWSYDDMNGLRTSIVSQNLPTNPMCPPVKQKLRKFKPNMSLKIKEEVTKQIKAKVFRVVEYPNWLANIVPVPKKYGNVRVCVDYRELNRASTKYDFPQPNIHIMIDNCAKHELQSFVDCFAGYHQIWMDEEDAEKIAFIILCGVYCYKMMPFGLKNAGSTYMRAMITIFHDMMEVYVDDIIIRFKKGTDHIADLRKFFDMLRRCVLGQHDGTRIKDQAIYYLREDITEVYDGWRMFFDRAANFTRVGIGAVLVLETGQHYPVSAKLKFLYTNNMAECEACILGLNMAVNMNVQELLNGFADALATLSSIIQHPDKNYIDPISVRIHNQPACAHVEEEADRKPWFHDIKDGGNMYRRTPDLGLLRCVDPKEASKLLKDVNVWTCGPHMNGFILAKKILRAGYFWMTMEIDCIKYVCKCFQCQVHTNMIKVPPNELNATSSPWPFATWEWMLLV